MEKTIAWYANQVSLVGFSILEDYRGLLQSSKSQSFISFLIPFSFFPTVKETPNSGIPLQAPTTHSYPLLCGTKWFLGCFLIYSLFLCLPAHLNGSLNQAHPKRETLKKERGLIYWNKKRRVEIVPVSQPCLRSAIPAPGWKTLTRPGRSASGLGIALINVR